MPQLFADTNGFSARAGGARRFTTDLCASLGRLPPVASRWDEQWVQTLHRPLAVAGVEPFASRLKAAPEELIRIFEPGDINVVVAGGETRGAWRMIGGRHMRTISVDGWR